MDCFMKKIGLGFALMVVALMCISGCKLPSGNKVQPAVANQEGLSEQDVTNRVYEIYSMVYTIYNAWASGDTTVHLYDYDFESEYCSRDWNNLVARVNEYDNSHEEIEMGFFDADYWVMGQDAQDLSISEVSVVKFQGDKAVVEFDRENCGSTSRIRLEMVYEDGEWKIDNFIDLQYELNWKENMKNYLTEMTGSQN